MNYLKKKKFLCNLSLEQFRHLRHKGIQIPKEKPNYNRKKKCLEGDITCFKKINKKI